MNKVSREEELRRMSWDLVELERLRKLRAAWRTEMDKVKVLRTRYAAKEVTLRELAIAELACARAWEPYDEVLLDVREEEKRRGRQFPEWV